MAVESFSVFAVLAVVLAIVTVIGHGIWVVLAWAARSLLGPVQQYPPADVEPCPYCNRSTLLGKHFCQWCSADLTSRVASQLGDLKAIERKLTRLRDSGIVTRDDAHGFLEMLKDCRAKLLATTRVAKPNPAKPAPEKAAPPAMVPVVVVEEPRNDAISAPVPPPLPPATGPFSSQATLAGSHPGADAMDLSPRQPLAPFVTPPVAPAIRPTVAVEGKGNVAAAVTRGASQAGVPGVEMKTPRRSLGEMLAEFMEPHNIRWGEIIGGLLFIVGAAALVVTQWQTLQQFRFSRFFVFLASTAAIFGVGLYSHYRWKLAATSRGLLTIATLLVPLNYLAMGGMSQHGSDLATWTFEAGSLLLFAWLLGLAGRIMVPGGRSLHTVSVLGGSIAVLLFVRRFDAGTPDALVSVAACLPVAFFAAGTGGYLVRWRSRRHLSRATVMGLFHLLGTGAFALVVALGLLVAPGLPARGFGNALGNLAVPLALSAVPILVTGLTIGHRTGRATSLEPFRTAGTWLALLGALVMLATLGLAWPQALTILLIAAIAATTLTLAAWVYRIPALHAGAIACMLLGYLCGYHLLAGHLDGIPAEQLGPHLLQQTISAQSGLALVGLFALLGIVSELLARCGRPHDGRVYALGCAVVALASLLLVTVHGIRDGGMALDAAATYAIYGLASLALNARYRRPAVSGLGLALLAATAGWWLWWQTGYVGPLWAAVLSAEGLALSVGAAVLGRFSKASRPSATGVTSAVEMLFANMAVHSWRETSLGEAFRLPMAGVADAVALLALTLGVGIAVHDADLISHNAALLWTSLCLVASGMVSAWHFRQPERTVLASIVAAVALVHAMVWNYAGMVWQPWLVALLTHATLAVLGGLLVEAGAARRVAAETREALRHVFAQPLARTAIVSSSLALPLFFLLPWNSTPVIAACLFWLAAVWLIIAWSSRWPWLLEAHRVVLTLAVVVAIRAWMEHHVAIAGFPLTAPWAYGIGLALLSLAWGVSRIVLRRVPVARQLLSPGYPAVDVLLKHGLVVAQLVLLLPGLGAQVLAGFGGGGSAAGCPTGLFGPDCWFSFGLLAAVIAVSLWQPWRWAEMADAILLAVALAAMVAGTFATYGTLNAALRWALAACFVIGSAALWQRQPLHRMLSRLGCRIRIGHGGLALAQSLLVALAVLPTVVLTVAGIFAIDQGITGQAATGGFFAWMGPGASYLVPLGLLALALVGHALAGRSAGYAFSAGLLVELATALAYVLFLHAQHRSWHGAELATWVQLPTIAAALWATAWLSVRRRFDLQREDTVWMRCQIALAIAGNALVLGLALAILIVFVTHPAGWVHTAGSPLGWLSLALTVLAVGIRLWDLRRPLPPHGVGLLGMAGLGLLACTIHVFWPDWGYRTLMLGWGAYALLVALCTWWAATIRTLPDAHGPPQALIRMAAVWVRRPSATIYPTSDCGRPRPLRWLVPAA
jgi:hypothetical protein